MYLYHQVESIEDEVQKSCQKIAHGNSAEISDEQKSELKKRKLLVERLTHTV